jgi:hypothetical protein
MSPRYGHGEVCDEVHLTLELVGDSTVQRHYYTAVVTFAAHGMGQRARYVCESAAARERVGFTRAVKYSHILSS